MDNIKLTGKQKQFADNYIKCGNALQSAIDAGYSYSYANARSYEMLGNIGIKEYITKVNKTIESEKIADMKEIKEFWTKTMRRETIDLKDALKASELIAKTNGAFIDKVEHSGGLDIVVEWVD